MTTLHGLKADLADPAGEWIEPRGIIESLHHEISPGSFVHIGLGTAGLTIRAAGSSVGIALDELLALAVPHLVAAEPARPGPMAAAPAPAALKEPAA